MKEIKLSDHFSYGKLLRFVFPSIIMMIFTSIYTIVDGFFVSNLAGKNAFAALNLIFPALMILAAFGFMLGTGGSALVAKTLGEGKEKRANEYFSTIVYVLVIGGILVAVLGFLIMRPVAVLLGASELTIDDCVIYGRILCVFLPFFVLQGAFQCFWVTEERAGLGMAVTVAAGVTNAILDFVFMYIFRMGLPGAALATGIGQLIGGVIPLLYFLLPNATAMRIFRCKPNLQAVLKASLNGASEMMTNLSASIVSILYNLQLMAYAAENGVDAYGVIIYVNFIFVSFFIGYAVGGSPIISYHYGAGNSVELKSLLRKSIWILLAAGVVMTVLGIALAEPIAGVFVGYDQELREMSARGMYLYSFSFLLCGMNIFGSAFFTALNNGFLSALISFLRTFVFQILAIYTLPHLLGLDGIWLAVTVAEGITLIFTVLLLVKNRGRYHY